MLQELFRTFTDSFVAPRKAARSIIDRVEDFTGVGVIFGLSFTLNAMILLTKSSYAPEPGLDGEMASGAFALIISNLIFSAVLFAMLCGIVYGVGRMFGGTGTLVNVCAALAWHSLITVVFSPFLSLASLSSDGGGMIGPVLIMLFVIWLLLNFVAEAHRFTSVWKVAAVMLGLLLIPAFLMSLAGMNTM